MKILAVILVMLSSMLVFGQSEIKLEEVKDHVGDSVKVRGFIKGIRYLQSSKGSTTLINLGKPYPDQTL